MHQSVQHKGHLQWASEAALWLPFTYIFSLTHWKMGSFSILLLSIIYAGQSSCHLGHGILEILSWIMSSASHLKGMISYNWVTDCYTHRVATELQLCFALKVEFLIAREEKGEGIEKLQYEHFALETSPKCHTGPLPVTSRVLGLFSVIPYKGCVGNRKLGRASLSKPSTLWLSWVFLEVVNQTFTAVRSDRSSWILQTPH